MPYLEKNRKTFSAAGIIPADCLVKLTASGVAAADAGDLPIGVTETGARMADEPVGVRMLNTSGSVEVVASAAVSVGQMLMPGAGGSVVPHDGAAHVVGVALVSSQSGGIVEMLPLLCPHIA